MIMKKEENIIQIRQRDIHQADLAFAEFMQKTEDCFNARSLKNPNVYKKISPSELEVLTVQMLQEISPSTPFRAEEIKLVAGHSFPDIMAEKYFGVEVKSTTKDKWTSIGSSIVESTRNKFVENIYMLFGKLGGNPPQFRCRPYQDCLSNIAVTHSPRYMIDMGVKDRKEKTIFDKLEVSYSEFCHREDKIDVVRNFYISQALSKNQMPWWVGRETMDETSSSLQIRLMNECSSEEKKDLAAQMVILFPQVINGDYTQAALWLCTHRYLLNLNLRDLFSAQGQWIRLNGEVLDIPYPAVLGILKGLMPWVEKNLLLNGTLEIYDFNKSLFKADNKLEKWLDLVDKEFKKYKYMVNKKQVKFKDLKVNVKELLGNHQNYTLKRK